MSMRFLAPAAILAFILVLGAAWAIPASAQQPAQSGTRAAPAEQAASPSTASAAAGQNASDHQPPRTSQPEPVEQGPGCKFHGNSLELIV